MSADPVSAYVALLRGINVAGKNRLPMRDLAPMFERVGCEAVQTYIQSGNVVFKATTALAARVLALVSDGIEERFGYRVPLVLRTAEELRDVVESNPFLRADSDVGKLNVAFLADVPERNRVEALDPDRSPPDEFQVLGREVFLHFPNGTARSKLTNHYFDLTLATTSTIRNWRTVTKLLAMAEGL